jgi:TRAP-type C4-dicarboxylate transport system permease small subunit
MSEQRLGHYPPKDFFIGFRALAAVSRFLALLEGIGIAICLVALVGLAVFQCVARNVRTEHDLIIGSWHVIHFNRHLGFPASPIWAIGILRHSVFLLGLLGAGFATYTARHIRIDAVTRMATGMRRLILRIITTIAALVLTGFLIKAGFDFLVACQMESGEASMSGQLFTSERGAWVIIFGMCLIEFHFFVQLLLDLGWVLKWKTPPDSWIAEAHGGDFEEDEVAPHDETAAKS